LKATLRYESKVWFLNNRQPASVSSTDEVSYTTVGHYRISPPEEYGYRPEVKSAYSEYSGRHMWASGIWKKKKHVEKMQKMALHY